MRQLKIIVPQLITASFILFLWTQSSLSQEAQTGESATQGEQTTETAQTEGVQPDSLSGSGIETLPDSLPASPDETVDTLDTGVDSLSSAQTQAIRSPTEPLRSEEVVETDLHPNSLICDQCGAVNPWNNLSCHQCGASLNKIKKPWSHLKNLINYADLDSGRTRSFRLSDGSVIEGAVSGFTGNDTANIDTRSGSLRVPAREVMVELAEVETREGLKFGGAVLSEDDHHLLLATPYSESILQKRDLRSTVRYYWDRKLVRDRIPIRAEELPDLFGDPTAYNLQSGTVYSSGFTVGYGFSNSFMLRTHLGRDFFGDLNLLSQYRILKKEVLGWEANLAVGASFFSSHAMRYEAGKYSHWIIDKINDRRLDESDDPALGRVLDDPEESTVFWSVYWVLSSRRGLQERRGNWGWHIGFATNALLTGLPALRPDYKWDEAFTSPRRIWLGFDYDITTRIKFIAKLVADNGHKIIETSEAFRSYYDFGGSPFRLDARTGIYKPLDLDFGLHWSISKSFRLEMHTGFPFISLSCRI